MRIERGEHALDAALDELFVGDRRDVIGADLLEDLAEQAERGGAAAAVLGRGSGGGDRGADAKQDDDGASRAQ